MTPIDGFTVQPLASHHDRKRFSCAEQPLTDYLQRLARQQDENNTTRVHVYANDAGEIAGYYTLSALTLELSGLPDLVKRGRPHLPVPATLLGRLATATTYENRGIGTYLLSHAMRTAYDSSAAVAAAFFVIDSKPRAIDFYRKRFPFEALPSNQLRLILSMDSIAKALQ